MHLSIVLEVSIPLFRFSRKYRASPGTLIQAFAIPWELAYCHPTRSGSFAVAKSRSSLVSWPSLPLSTALGQSS